MTTMPNLLPTVLIIMVSYALGCFSTAYYLVRWRTGQDIRQIGSGSAGARNVGRVLGRSGFALTFLGDALKGTLAVWLARTLDLGALGMVLALLAVVAGHLWPVQLGGKGGKGASTALGGALVINVWLGVATLLAALFFLGITRSVSRSGMLAMALVPLLAWLLALEPTVVTGMVVLVILLLYAHRHNWSSGRATASPAPVVASGKSHEHQAP